MFPNCTDVGMQVQVIILCMVKASPLIIRLMECIDNPQFMLGLTVW